MFAQLRPAFGWGWLLTFYLRQDLCRLPHACAHTCFLEASATPHEKVNKYQAASKNTSPIDAARKPAQSAKSCEKSHLFPTGSSLPVSPLCRRGLRVHPGRPSACPNLAVPLRVALLPLLQMPPY